MQLEHGLMEAIHNAAHNHRATPARAARGKLNVLILYAEHSCFTQTVLDHLLSFKLFTDLNVYYADAVVNAQCNLDLEIFDAVILHYGTGLYHPTYFSASFETALRGYSGLKIAFTQDEYDSTEILRRRIEDLGIHVFYTCVPEKHIQAIYPKERFPHVRFMNTLTGYVPIEVDLHAPRKPVAERPIAVGYRGRPLHPKYGLLGRDKLVIGQRMKAICEQENLSCDIAWQEETRIYWSDWFRFLENCRVTLGTESGSNVFDFDGSLRGVIDAEIKSKPDVSFEELYQKHVAQHEGKYGRMNQISPRVFEAMALRTGLVLFEGEYSGIIKPDLHYIPLRKDFGNIREVLEKIRDDRYLTELTDRAFQDIILPGAYSYSAFAEGFAEVLSQNVGAPRGVRLVSSLVAAQRRQTQWFVFDTLDPKRAALQFSNHTEDTVVFPMIADPVQTATAWPIYHKEHMAITLKTTPTVRQQVQKMGCELMEGPAAVIAHTFNLNPRGFALVLIALLALPYPVYKLIPASVRKPLRGVFVAMVYFPKAVLRMLLKRRKNPLLGLDRLYVAAPPMARSDPNTVHIAFNLSLNRVGGQLVERLYPYWESSPPWFKAIVRKPAIVAMRFFRAA